MKSKHQNGNVLLVVLLCLLITLVVGIGVYTVATRTRDDKVAPTAQKNNSTTSRTITEWGVTGDASGLPADTIIQIKGDQAYFTSVELDTALNKIKCDIFCVPNQHFYIITREMNGVTLPDGEKANQTELAVFKKIGDYYYLDTVGYAGSYPSNPTVAQIQSSELINTYNTSAKKFLKSLRSSNQTN